MLTTFKIILKKYLPFYSFVRSITFPYYEKKRSSRIQKMPEYGVSQFTCFGITFPLYLSSSNGFVDEEIYWKGCYEEEVLKIIQEELPTGGTYIDIGSNIGQHALFASVINPTGRVVAFEPITKLYQQFLDSIAINKITTITLHKKACGESEMQMNINFSEKNMGGASLVEESNRESYETISIIQGDTILMSESRIDLIKVDTEGFELEVLRGILGTIRKHRPKLLIEYSPILYSGPRTQNGALILELLEEENYEIVTIDDGGKIHLTKNLTDLAKSYSDQVNILCTPLLKK